MLEDVQRFPILGSQRVFLNHAAVAPISGPAAAVLKRYAEHAASAGTMGWDWYSDLRKVRGLAARMINAEGPGSIAFIPNTSTGLGLVAGGLDWRPGDEVVLTNVEYPANRYCWHALRRRGVKVIEVEEGPDLRVDAEAVIDAITDRTRVVAISHAQWHSGYRVDVKAISEVVHQAGGYLCLDAIQTVGAMPVDVRALGVDFLAADGHKWMLGPEGAGVFYCRPELCEMLTPVVTGWIGMVDALRYEQFRFEFRKDARRFEPGTWNVPGVLALGASLELLLEIGLERVWGAIEERTAWLRDGLRERGCEVVSPGGRDERCGIVAFLPQGGKSAVEEEYRRLREAGFELAMRAGRLRVSPHCYTPREGIDALLEAVG